MYCFIKVANPPSPTKPQPPLWYIVAYSLSSLMWFAAMACEVLVLINTLPFDGDEDRGKGLQDCGRYNSYKCYHATTNAKLNTLVKMSLGGVSLIV